MNHVLFCGKTRSGKTNSALCWVIQNAMRVIIWLGKETRAGAEALAKWSIENNKPFIIDDLDKNDLVFPLAVLPRTDDEHERQLNIEGLMESLMRRRGSAHADANPLIETVSEHFCNLIYQLDLNSRQAFALFREGRVPDVSESSDFWNDIPRGYGRERVVGPTERLFSILKKPSIKNRLVRDQNDFINLIDQGISYYLQGGDRISQSEIRFLMGMRLNQVIQYKRSGGKQPVTIVIEESEALGLTMQEAVAIQTLAKTDTSFVLICQEPQWDQK